MATVGFEELALRYVFSDDQGQAREAAQQAASLIEAASANKRVLVGEWVSSINRWMPQADNGERQDDDFISRAKALDFLASTLEILKKDTLRADQIQLLVKFFCSLFSSDHKAGVTASAKALRELTNMKFFKPLIGNDIIEGIFKLDDDFTSQTPATRLEIYELVLGLLQDQSVANELEYRHGNTCGFMTGLLHLCRNERDPNNLMKWFETLKIFLQNFSPSDEVTLEVFKRFSAYFPIALRASATPSGITPEDLKRAVRSCFAAHHRLASHTIPYLIAKLDQGDAVTVAVKVDILQTLDACVSQYAHSKQSVVPYVDKIWSSLKYEVRNGEVPETIEATLKVITSLTRRLDEDDLRLFFNTAWRDLAEDVASPTYIDQASKLLLAILGASAKSFSMVTSALTQVQNTIKSTKSASHQRDLLALLNSILLVRSHLVANDDVSDSSGNLLRDDLFGDSIYFVTYLPLWEMPSDNSATERVEISIKLMEGMAALVGQESYGAGSRRLITDTTCAKIFKLLSELSIEGPLRGTCVVNKAEVVPDYKLRSSAASALIEAIPQYPEGFQQLLLLFIESVQGLYQTRSGSDDFILEISRVVVVLCDTARSEGLATSLALSDYMSLIHAFMDVFFWMLEKQALPKYWSAFISAMNLAMLRSLDIIARGFSQSDLQPQPLSAEVYAKLTVIYEQTLQTELLVKGTNETTVQLTKDLNAEGYDYHQQLLAYCLCVLKKFYCRFTDVYPTSNETGGKQWSVGLHKDFVSDDWKLVAQQDIGLHQLALLATSIVRALDEDEQKSLRIDQDAFQLFHLGHDNLPAEISSLHDYRTAPLTMGILRGIFPGVLDVENHVSALHNLNAILVTTPTTPSSEVTRVTLDTIWTILSNKFVIKGDERKSQWLALQDKIIESFMTIWSRDESETKPSDAIRVFRSILHFISGDVARFQGDPTMNSLLRLVCEKGPVGPAMGRQLAKNFEILLSPQECLCKENHAIRKRLAGAWIYHNVVQPDLKKCIPTSSPVFPFFPPDLNEMVQERREAVNRAIAIFSMLKYAKYDYYADDVEKIVRIAIRSLGSLEHGVEMASCLTVLLQILEKDPDALKGHLSSLTAGMINVYLGASQKSIRKSQAAGISRLTNYESPLVSPHDERALSACRKMTLEFLYQLPAVFEAHALIPYRNRLLRPLSITCGDPVREIRRIALAARQAWENLK